MAKNKRAMSAEALARIGAMRLRIVFKADSAIVLFLLCGPGAYLIRL
jgi:hypothetical protein